MSHLNSYHPNNQGYYGMSSTDSPNLAGSYQSMTDSPAFPPAAPTPPSQSLGHSQFLPGPMNPIGTGRDAGDDRTANLLSLLKNSGQGGPKSSQQASREASMALPQVPMPPSIIHLLVATNACLEEA